MSTHLPQYRAMERLERLLGDPAVPGNTVSFQKAMTLDEAEQFPEAAVSLLHGHDLHRHYVPLGLGGRFDQCEEFVALGRVLARRDMNLAASYSTMLWTMLAWIGGNPNQQRRIADLVLHSAAFPCLAYSEQGHGADLAANGLSATLHDGFYTLAGEKWPINRATRSDLLVLLARTRPDDAVRSQSLFILDKRRLDPASYYHLPRVKTHGLRGCDISGIGLRGCAVEMESRIGDEGAGIELALKGFQVTRTFCASLSLGCGDTMLRGVTDFLASRTLYGGVAIDIPHTREVLANSYLSLLMAEAAAIIGARGLHLFPEQFSTWSTVVKVQVARLVDHAAAALTELLGARSYMREQHQDGIFQKMLRDNAIVAIFDGSSVTCLDALASQLPLLARTRARNPDLDWATLYDLRAALTPFQPDRMAIFGRGRDAVTASLPHLLVRLQALRPDADCPEERLSGLREAAGSVAARLQRLEDAATSGGSAPGKRMAAARFALAEDYCALHTAIASLGLWLYNRQHLGSFFAGGAWLLAGLRRFAAARFATGDLDPELCESLMRQLLQQQRSAGWFSLLPLRLAEPGAAELAPSRRMPEPPVPEPPVSPTAQPRRQLEDLFVS